jgi:2-aminoadipate transaminase
VPAACELYAAHWRAVERAFERHMPAECSWSEPTGGFFTWLRLPEHLDAMALRSAAVEAGVAYVPGAPFYPADGGADELRIAFSYLGEQELETAVERLAGVIAERA